MKIPKGMTENEVVQVIQKVSNRLSGKFVFGFYDREDLEQEAFIMALSALDNYDQEQGPLENFLHVHLSNRLKNFKRDKFFRINLEGCSERRKLYNDSKRALMEPVRLVDGAFVYDHEGFEEIEMKEIVEIVKDSLPTSLKHDFERMANGVPLSKSRKDKVVDAVKEMFNEEG